MIDPLKQAVLSHILIETLPDAVNFRCQMIKRQGYRNYRRSTERFIVELKIIAQRNRKTVDEYGMDWIYSIFQSKFCKNNKRDYCKKVQFLLIYLEERGYFENWMEDPVYLEIATESLSQGVGVQ